MNTRTKHLMLNFLIEMLIYGLLLLIYFLAVLRLLGEPLNQLFHLYSLAYALIALLIIVIQAGKQNLDLIVMSTHGRSGLGRWIHGSVTEEELCGATCATLVIREQESIHKDDGVRMKGV